MEYSWWLMGIHSCHLINVWRFKQHNNGIMGYNMIQFEYVLILANGG
jgi:hypothetical protein